MKLFHQTFGVLVLIVFLLTGQYMDRFHNHLQGVPDGVRMVFRSRHIYILLAGLLNLGIGAYLIPRRESWRRVMQVAGSVLIVAATFLMVVAFFYEPTLRDLHTPVSRWGVDALVAGTFAHLLSGARRRDPDDH